MLNNIIIRNSLKSYALLFMLGILAGVVCRLSDFLPYESLWSFSSIATLLGFWIASVGLITLCSASNGGAFINTFLYMFGMTLSFYGLKYILGFFLPMFANDGFQTGLFLMYSMLSLVCAFGSFVLYCWNNGGWFGSILYALPAAGLLAEGVGCLIVLFNGHMLLAQTIFDFGFGLWFGISLFRRADNKILYLATMAVVILIVFWQLYKPFLLLYLLADSF